MGNRVHGAVVCCFFMLLGACQKSNDHVAETPRAVVDECENDTDDCDTNATCTDRLDGFTCACNEGYTGNGIVCVVRPQAPTAYSPHRFKNDPRLLGWRGGSNMVVTVDGTEPVENSTQYNNDTFLILPSEQDTVTVKSKVLGTEAGNLSDASTLQVTFYYVNSASVVSTEDGSISAPFKTITSAVTAANVNASNTHWYRILVASGDYAGNITLSKAVSLFGSGSTAILNGRLTVNGESRTAHTVVNGLRITGQVVIEENASMLFAHNVIDYETTEVLTILNVYGSGSEIVRNHVNVTTTNDTNSTTGIYLQENSGDTLIFGNHIAITGNWSLHGIRMSASTTPKIINNTIDVSNGSVLWTDQSDAKVQNNDLFGNVWVACRSRNDDCVYPLLNHNRHEKGDYDASFYLLESWYDGNDSKFDQSTDTFPFYLVGGIFDSPYNNTWRQTCLAGPQSSPCIDTMGLNLSSEYPGATDLRGVKRSPSGGELETGWSTGAYEWDSD